MGKLIDLTGERFGRLTVLERVEDGVTSGGHKVVRWKCKCICGTEVTVSGNNLRSGGTVSCGCFSAELRNKRNFVHGWSNSRLYGIWKGMKGRCERPSHRYYNNYGGRGITLCEEWKDDFTSFRAWAVNSGYRDDLTIDRIDMDSGYSPENCRWVTMKVQNNHKRNNRLITCFDETHTLAEWAKITGINRGAILDRLKRGWKVERALSEPVDTKFRNNK